MSSLSWRVAGPRWAETPTHRAWLLKQAGALFDFFEPQVVNPLGGFHDLDDSGRAVAPGYGAGGAPARQLHGTTRMVHAFSIAWLMGRPGADRVVDHGMAFLWDGHRDPVNGGYSWGVGYGGPTDPAKQAYGHAFVLLAASSAKVAGHPDADRLLADVSEIIRTRFWEETHGASAEEFAADWKSLGPYRGQNSNMHLTEALMAAFEATEDSTYLRMAERIAELIIRRHAADHDWRVPEHYTEGWEVDCDYSGSPVFRPYGTTPGHALEWARLVLTLWELGNRRLDWLPGAARALFARATEDGWDRELGGFYYTLEWDGRPRIRDRYWWPCCEAIGAAAVLNAIDRDPRYEAWYREIWSFVAAHFLDRDNGGWRAQLDAGLRPNEGPFFGKIDIYHALQACLVPLLPTSRGIARGVATEGVSVTP
jgi:sulfoquinovose isomerase